MFSVDRHGSGAVGKGGATPENVFSHYGPVTGIACHPNPEFGSLLLTSSFDRRVLFSISGLVLTVTILFYYVFNKVLVLVLFHVATLFHSPKFEQKAVD